ncbi:MAG: lactonase family protein [Pseudomonadota bacterium]
MLAFIGTYTHSTGSAGIYTVAVGGDGRYLLRPAESRGIENPSWLISHPSRPVIYAVSETSANGAGGVTAFAYDNAGALTQCAAVSSLGSDPCHLAIDSRGSRIYVANYSGGNFASFSLLPDGAMGELLTLVQHTGRGIDPVRQKHPHVHSLLLDEQSGQVFVADLGTDKLFAYPATAAGVDVAGRRSYPTRPGAGPRLACMDATGSYLWLINELDNTVVAYGVSAGVLTELATVPTLPPEFDDASYCAHIAVSSDGKFLYASNRGHDSITVFALEDGQPVPCQWQPSGGRHPRYFCLSPGERELWVANRDDNNISVFERDTASGRLGECVARLEVPAPVCILFVDPAAS